ncbi:threonine--tRNA ligase [Phycisphaerales bacterium AB-hyl4]|uniref:Threonine--tRNA ligase n=1 Tax=Natronomicrosphaera hydrolytica TaxID=3242702 RepID=A0ABV4U5V6_9BACT
MKITLPDGSEKQYDGPVSAREVAAEIGAGLAKAAIGAKVDGVLVDADRPIAEDAKLEIVTAPRQDKKGRSKFRDEQHEKDALYLLRHSTAHVMAEAIQRIWPEAMLAYGPPLDTGFYYDIALATPISASDFEKIEAEMQKIVAEDRPFTRYELATDVGMKKLDAEGNKYKLDNAQRAIEGGAAALSWYVTGEVAGVTPRDGHPWALQDVLQQGVWEDLCQGPHVPATGLIGAFKVTSIAQSHWHGDVTSDKFQRVYGTAFFSAADLDAHMEQLEQARQRDHRVLGQRLGLFTIDEMVGQGLILWKPKGAVVRDELQKFISEHLRRQGYSQVFTPHIGKLDLFKTSGHFPYYQDSQYPPMIHHEHLKHLADEGCTCAQLSASMREGDIEGYLLKPMNCPFHIKIFDSEKRSYRDLPIRLAEFGTVYRWEQSGEIGGMTRVRGFTQDDAHLFVTEDQLDDEVAGCLELVKIVFATLGMDDYRVRVGLRDPDGTKYVGEPSQWDKAEAACKRAAAGLGVPFVAEPGEAAFYGPKIDFVVRDVIGREWQLGTVQVDYQLPQRFDLSYVGADNKSHRPVMIHRAPFGSMERFVGVLIEHFNGAFPTWLSPEQVRVLPISDKFVDYAQQVADELKAAGVRVSMDDGNDRLNAKIKVAQDAKVPYMLVVGGKDQDAGTVSVRHRSEGDLGAMPREAFVTRIGAEIAERSATVAAV